MMKGAVATDLRLIRVSVFSWFVYTSSARATSILLVFAFRVAITWGSVRSTKALLIAAAIKSI